MRNKKPKKWSKVLCIAEDKSWAEDTLCPPRIGWVYLVDVVQKMNADFTDEDPKGKRRAIGLMGFGTKKKDSEGRFLYDADFFRVVGKGKIISAQ